MSGFAIDDGIRTCRYCLWDIRFDDTGWTLAWGHTDYACEAHDGHHGPRDMR